MEGENGEYIKHFNAWNEKKKILDKRVLSDNFFFLEREVWWASIGVNIGKEIDGKHEHFERPILVIKKFSSDLLWGLPISTQEKDGEFIYITMYKGEKRTIPLLQLRSFTIQRLRRIIYRIDEEEFVQIKKRLINILLKSDSPYL